MGTSLSITASMGSAELLELPWHLPLEKWPKETVAALPKGISRHTVRFVHLGPHIVAIKERPRRWRSENMTCCENWADSMFRVWNRWQLSQDELTHRVNPSLRLS